MAAELRDDCIAGPRLVRVAVWSRYQPLAQAAQGLLRDTAGITSVVAVGERPFSQSIRECAADIIVIDVDQALCSMEELIHQASQSAPGAKVIAVSGYPEPRLIASAMAAGAAAFVLKDCLFEDLSAAVREVMRDQIFLSPAIKGRTEKFQMTVKKEPGP